MRKGCLLALLMYTSLVAVYRIQFAKWWEPPATWLVPLVAGLVTLLAIGAIMTAWDRFRQWGQVSRARLGIEPRDGARAAAAGTVRPVGEPLEAPFSRTPCVLYEYEMRKQRTSKEGDAPIEIALGGNRAEPWLVSGVAGDTVVLGFPELEQEPKRDCCDLADYTRARAFFERTEFVDVSGAKVLKMLSEVIDVMADDDGSVEKNWQRTPGAREWLHSEAWDRAFARLTNKPISLYDYIKQLEETAGKIRAEAMGPGGAIGSDAAAGDVGSRDPLSALGSDAAGPAPIMPSDAAAAHDDRMEMEADSLHDDEVDDDFDDELDDDDDDDDDDLDDDELDEMASDASADDGIEESRDARELRRAPSLSEKCLFVGEEVCVFGVYSEEHRAIMPSLSRKSVILRLMRGDPETIERKLRASILGNLIGGIVVLVLVHLALIGATYAFWHDSSTVERREVELSKAAEKGDLKRMSELLELGVSPDHARHGGSILASTDKPEVVDLLLAHGADVDARDSSGYTPLMVAARNGRIEILEKLLAAGADKDAVDTEYRETALMKAIHSEEEEAVAVLRAAGAHDDTVTDANGDAVDADSPPVRACVAYVEAIHAQDPARLLELSATGRGAEFDDVDWVLWRNTRPAGEVEFSGFYNTTAATIAIRGATPSGSPTMWVFQLALEGSDWKIVREREVMKNLPQ